ncbi:MAG: sulfite exporter TauE/SafE family protein [Sedimentisphaerales bacterium]|nr:sulfite exporter TauE/SafE family protein [Sedimentisphaerales bacterium]
MTEELRTLVIAAASIGFFHTLLGPDHYLPFIMMSWARRWSGAKTAVITLICALGHIAGSVVLGLVGVSLGWAVKGLEAGEAARGTLAAWLLIAFGLAYLIWGLRFLYRRKPHQHSHPHLVDATHPHAHRHTHLGEHAHVHDLDSAKTVTPWVLFVIFVFGPCEPLIPFLMYPAAKGGLPDLVLITAIFGVVTAATMLGAVFLGRAGVDFLPLKKIQHYSHALAGATILLCGLAIQFLGL